MGLWSDSTYHLKQRSKHAFTDPTGLTNSPGFSWALELFPRKTLKHHLPLTLPGEFINPDTNHLPVTNIPFQTIFQKVTPTSHHGTITPHLSPTIKDAQFVFIRRDGHRGPLQRTYDGPFRVIGPGDKTFIVMVGGREETISIDRLKPAHVDLSHPVPVVLPPRRGRPPQIVNPQQTTMSLPTPVTIDPPNLHSSRSGRIIKVPL